MTVKKTFFTVLKVTALAGMGLLLLAGCATNKADLKKQARYDKYSDEQLYKKAIKHIKKGHNTLGIESLEALDARYPFGDYADKALLLAIYAHYEADDYASAAATAERFIRVHPRHPNVDYAYYMKGLISSHEYLGFGDRYFPMERYERDQSSAKKSFHEFLALSHKFPNSVYTPDAKKRMVYLRNNIASGELDTAKFYLKKGAYVAAINRGYFVLDHFDQTPSTEEALSVIILAYRALGINDLAHDNLLILQHNFPHSKYLAG
jgi:outer membrane protein assembly factor BamD